MEQRKKVIFIGSTSRSGSTILDMMLGHGEGCFSLAEVNAHFRPYRKHHIKSLCACGDAFCKIRRSFKGVTEKGLYDHVFSSLKAHTIIDSSKELTWMLDQYDRLSKRNDLDVHIVLIYKSPVSLAHSYFKRGESIDKYKKQYKYYQQLLETGLPFITVEYAALAKSPSDTLRHLCERLGIDYFEGKENYWQKEMHHFFGSNSVIQTYESDVPEIKATEKFREDFIPLIEKIETDVANDQILSSITKTLEDRNILKENDSVLEKSKVYRPLWYYRRKLKAIYRKRFPQEYQERVIPMR